MGDLLREMLVDRTERLRETIDGLERERAALGAQLEAQALTNEQVQIITEFAQDMGQGLDVAESDFEARRHLIDLLNVQATLAVEDGRKIIHARCVLGKARLSVEEPTSRS